jgi:hypothetical protein
MVQKSNYDLKPRPLAVRPEELRAVHGLFCSERRIITGGGISDLRFWDFKKLGGWII